MQVDDFDFDLPDSLIALRPAQPRDTARLLHIPAGKPRTDRSISDLPDMLRAGDVDSRITGGSRCGEKELGQV